MILAGFWLTRSPLYVPDPHGFNLLQVCPALGGHNTHPPTQLRSSRPPPRLTEGLAKILAEADVGELQHLAPFLTLAFPVSATTCRAHKISTTSYEARPSGCSLTLPGAERGDTLCPFTCASPGNENKTEVVPPLPGWWNKSFGVSDCQGKRMDQTALAAE